ncbi:DMT family transporter [Labilibaculum sp. DW002]|uniref:DMT family transporter n=1 Tax=Paralabilibaculum antarcticum TaxID=2912572 RepID=A0ABT5VVW1_9BACT|nr:MULTISPECIES: DMT family transporter [unclassified Labilibaculum]MBI9059739.1 DMT family transporter [Labilibaculum sp.]MDE5419446.1 DMT family transporter [Labilibaculum sp. DW002]|eukprot:TRINITY_DN25694_c0_g1_i1.p1 TRINITY_DN25694_c0_g1~~TRINITY_DN25694_c0_g1_i1.p1  ORF type:complete len:148 (+),score=15.88 TRINITY_DN25694_c0_g1_i1:252-695(+)
MRYFLMLLALAVGCLLPIQASLNAKLGGFLKAPIMAALVNFMVGGFILLLIILGTRTPNNLLLAAKEAPIYAWIGGLMGATFVGSIIFLIPRLGAALSFGLIVAGQLVFSMVIDHFGMFGIPVQPINWGRAFGVALILTGVLVIQKF